MEAADKILQDAQGYESSVDLNEVADDIQVAFDAKENAAQYKREADDFAKQIQELVDDTIDN